MTTLTVTAQGQIKFRNVVLKHFGIRPGGKFHYGLHAEGEPAPTVASRTQDAETTETQDQRQPARH